MNVGEQMEPGGGADGKLADVTLEDLIREIKTRCHAVVVAMLVDDDESGEELTLFRRLGGRVTCIGLCRDAEATMIHEGINQEGE